METEHVLGRAASTIYFCDDSSRARKISRHDFTAEQKHAIREFHSLNPWWNLVIPFHYLIWLTCGWIACSSNIMTLRIFAFALAGLSLSTLSVLAHESSHNLITRNPRVDRWVGFLCGLPVLFSSAGYRVMHPLHHKFLGSEGDPDNIENVSKNSVLLRIVYVAIFFAGVYLYLVSVPAAALRKGNKDQRKGIILELTLTALAVVTAILYIPVAILLNGWIIPLLIAGQIANIRGIAEHGFTTHGNELNDTRTVTSNRFLSFMICNINYHLEHHLYPGVPWYNLPRIHALLQHDFEEAGSSVYQSYWSFLSDVGKALWSGVIPGSRLIPAHIREQVCI
ncbi:MAG TPA: fatty acid desaturase [Bacteroidota bacterium]|nr:fatty acid desaturase [Bacteroidota bacterium]